MITFNLARVASLVLLRYILESAIGLSSDTTKKSLLQSQFFYIAHRVFLGYFYI